MARSLLLRPTRVSRQSVWDPRLLPWALLMLPSPDALPSHSRSPTLEGENQSAPSASVLEGSTQRGIN